MVGIVTLDLVEPWRNSLSSVVGDWFVRRRCWSVQPECCWEVEVPGSICMALRRAGVGLGSHHCKVELGEALGCAVAVEVGRRLRRAVVLLCKAVNPCLGTCHSNNRYGSNLGGCVACIHQSDDHACRILGRKA